MTFIIGVSDNNSELPSELTCLDSNQIIREYTGNLKSSWKLPS